MTLQPEPANNLNDERSSLLSILSKVKKESHEKEVNPVLLSQQDRDSIASYFRQNKKQTQ